MKNIIISFLAICVAVAWGSNSAPLSSPIPPSCAILDKNWKLWDVSSKFFNSTDGGRDGWHMSVNLCQDMERSCAHTANEPCSVCQYVPNQDGTETSYCLGYSKDEVYSPLDQSLFPGQTGFLAALSGDPIYCTGNVQRKTFINVLCNQANDMVQFVNESSQCVYVFTLSLKQSCQVSAASFTPTFTITSVTPNSFTVTIDDGYPYEFWHYNVKVNNKYAYQGSHRDILIQGLDAGTTYSVVVERDSSEGAVMTVTSPSVTLSVTTLAEMLGSSKGSGVGSVGGTTIVQNTSSGTASGVAIGLVIAAGIVLLVLGFLKLRQTDFWADKFGGSGSRSSGKGNFSLLDAEKSNAFE